MEGGDGACGPSRPVFVTFTQSKSLLQNPLTKDREHDSSDEAAVFPDSDSATQTVHDPIARDVDLAVKLDVPTGQLQATKLSPNVRKETKPQSFTDPALVEETGNVDGEGSNYSVQEFDLVPEPKQASDFGLRNSERVITPLSFSDVTALSGAATFQGDVPETAILDEADETPISDGMPGTVSSDKILGVYLSGIPEAGSDEISEEAGISHKISEAVAMPLSDEMASMPLSDKMATMALSDEMATMFLSDEMANIALSNEKGPSSEDIPFYNEKADMPLCNEVLGEIPMAVKTVCEFSSHMTTFKQVVCSETRTKYFTYWSTSHLDKCTLVTGFQNSPIQCTDRSTKRSSASAFFDMEFYKRQWPLTWIYYISDDVYAINFKSMVQIGKGGNGIVYRYGDYVIKETRYDKNQLNLISKLNHPNVIRLLGVVLVDPRSSPKCFHIMEVMTGDLDKAMSMYRTEGLLWHIANTSVCEATIISNLHYICMELLKGLRYMSLNYVRHGDIKGKNVLYHKKCQCPNILLCVCPVAEKCSLMLADFDYICKIGTEPHRREGTLTYRSPELELIGQGCEVGIPSDIYSLGVLLLRVILGESTDDDAKNANIVLRQPITTELTIYSEVGFVQMRLKKFLYKMCDGKHTSLACWAKLVADCLEPNYINRPSIEQLIKRLNEV